MYNVTVQKTVVDENGDEVLYSFTSEGDTQEAAMQSACNYATMVEYGLQANKWAPTDDLAFPEEQLYQFIQPSQLGIIKQMYPNAVPMAYQNALAYVQSYIGAMFNVDEMLRSEYTTSTVLTLRLALSLQTAVFLLASSAQYSETIEMLNKQLHMLLRGLKSGNRNMGKAAVIGEPDVRVDIVDLTKTGNRP